MENLKKYWLIYLGAVIVIMAGVVFEDQYRLNNALKDSVVVIGTVKGAWQSRNGTVFEFEATFGQRKIILRQTTQYDSLKMNSKVKFRISKREPEKYYQYIGIIQ